MKYAAWILGATASAAVAQNSPPPGHAMEFNGGYVAVADSTWFDFDRTVTLEAWIKPLGSGPGLREIVGQGDGINYFTDRNFGFFWYMDTGQPGGEFFRADGSAQFAAWCGLPSVPTPAWVHVSVVFDGNAGVVRVFRNGVLEAERITTRCESTDAFGPFALRHSSRPLQIGQREGFTSTQFIGLMDEIRIWNVARTATEIATSYNVSLDPHSPGLVAYFTFEEGTGSTVQDRTGHGLDGSVHGNTAWAPVVPPCTVPVVTQEPLSQTACSQTTVAFTATASGTSPSFQWRKNEAVIEGALSPTYTIHDVTPTDAGSYDCVVTNACGAATSNPATLTVRTPQILTQPVSQTVNVDQPVFFALEADPQHPCHASLAYRWQRRNPLVEDDGAPNAWLDLSDGGGLSGTHTPNLAIFRPTPGLATGYRCRLTNACGCEADANGIIYTDTVNFAAACPSDFNNDGSVDGDDVIEFFERWDAGC